MMINPRTYDIGVSDSVINPNKPLKKGGYNAFYKETSTSDAKANNLYKVHIFLTGNDLAFVKRATYVLHETFANPVQTVERTMGNQNCMLTIWTWGIFTVRVEIEDQQGNKIRLEHRLQYGREIQERNKDLSWGRE